VPEIGRKNKQYHKSLADQVYEKLVSMQAFGASKKQAVTDGTETDKIFSYGTYHAYKKQVKYFIQYMGQVHPECTTLDKAKRYVKEYLEYREHQKKEDGTPAYSAWTMHLATSALCKLFQIKKDDKNRYHAPKRRRSDIRRSRVGAARDKHFSVTNNDELIKFCQGTGLRRAGMQSIRGRDLFTATQIADEIARIEAVPVEGRTESDRKWLTILKDTLIFENPRPEYYARVTEKGGRLRLSPIIGPYVEQIVKRFRDTAPDDRVWQYVNTNADIHSYRADYCKEVYKLYARPIDELMQIYDPRQVYICRRDEAGRRYDRGALRKCSKALGHNRVDSVVSNYLRNL